MELYVVSCYMQGCEECGDEYHIVGVFSTKELIKVLWFLLILNKNRKVFKGILIISFKRPQWEYSMEHTLTASNELGSYFAGNKI